MANNYDQVTVEPFIPKDLLSEEDYEKMSKFGFSREASADYWYLFSDDYHSVTVLDDDTEIYEEDLFKIFQKIIKASGGELKHIILQGAETCDKMRPGEFGGWAVFITEKKVDSFNTWDWVAKKKHREGKRKNGKNKGSDSELLEG